MRSPIDKQCDAEFWCGFLSWMAVMSIPFSVGCLGSPDYAWACLVTPALAALSYHTRPSKHQDMVDAWIERKLSRYLN